MSDQVNVASVAWDRCGTLNAAVAEEAFGRHAAGLPVYLDLEQDVLGRVARCLSDAPLTRPDELLCEIVRATLPDPEDAPGVFHLHVARILAWESKGYSPAPTEKLHMCLIRYTKFTPPRGVFILPTIRCGPPPIRSCAGSPRWPDRAATRSCLDASNLRPVTAMAGFYAGQ